MWPNVRERRNSVNSGCCYSGVYLCFQWSGAHVFDNPPNPLRPSHHALHYPLQLTKHKMQAESRHDAASQLRTEPPKLGVEAPECDGPEENSSYTKRRKSPQPQSRGCELTQQQSHMHKSLQQQSRVHKLPSQQSRGRAPPGVTLSRMEPPPPRPSLRARSTSTPSPRVGHACVGAPQVQRGFNSTSRAPEHLGRSRSQREISLTGPGATERSGGWRSTTRLLCDSQAGVNATAATEATAASVATAATTASATSAVAAIEAVAQTGKEADIAKTATKAVKGSKTAKADAVANSTKAIKSHNASKAQAPTARCRQSAAKPRPSRSPSGQKSGQGNAGGHGNAGGQVYAGKYVDAAAHGEAMGRCWGLGKYSPYSRKQKEENAVKALVELRDRASWLECVPRRR